MKLRLNGRPADVLAGTMGELAASIEGESLADWTEREGLVGWTDKKGMTGGTEARREKEEHSSQGFSWVYIANGYCVEASYRLKEQDQVFLIPRGKMPRKKDLEAMLCSRHTPGVHEKVKQGRIAVAGLGGLGSNIAMMLARTGVGELLLVDYDVVEPSNLNRQHYRIAHLGMKKTEAMRQQIEEINPYIVVYTRDLRITEDNAAQIFAGYPVVCEALDSPEGKAWLVQSLLENSPKTYIVSGSGMAGYESSNSIHTRKSIGRLYVCGDEQTAAQAGRGLMAPRVQVCAGHQANMALRLLLGYENA